MRRLTAAATLSSLILVADASTAQPSVTGVRFFEPQILSNRSHCWEVTMTAATTGQENFGEKNAKHFDTVAPGEWPQWIINLHIQTLEFLKSSEFASFADLPPAGDGTDRRLLDYACGDGLISRALKPYFSSALGVDVSGKMLDKFRKAAAAAGYGTDEMTAVRADFVTGENDATDPPLPVGKLKGFDLIAISMALHHLEDPEAGLKRLAARLKAGGKFLVIDWTPVDGSTPSQRLYQEELKVDGLGERVNAAMRSHHASHTVSRPDGFTKEEQEALFGAAGCGDMRWKLADEMSEVPVIPGAKGQLYWAVATKSAWTHEHPSSDSHSDVM